MTKKKEIHYFEIEDKTRIDNEIEEYISIDVPIVIYGEVGKSFFLEKKFESAYVIDAREMLDFKNLCGYYAFKNEEIKYNNGILIDSMKEGRILIVKRIDLNMNLLYFLYSIIKYRKIVNSLGEEYKAHKDFKIIFTSRDRLEIDDLYFVGPIRFSLNNVLLLKEPVKSCIKNLIIFALKNRLKKCLYNEQVKCGKICTLRNAECLEDANCCFESEYLCGVHFRSLVQLIKNIDRIDKLTFDNRLSIYSNFCNIFLKHDSEEVLTFLNLNQPQQTVLYEEDVARTYPFLFGVRNLVINVKNAQHSLLIGETGAGKTSVVQYLARNSQRYFNFQTSLKIINMSSDFDGSDLIGGYCTLNIDKKIRSIYDRFNLSKPNTLDSNIFLSRLKEYLATIKGEDIQRYLELEKEINEIEKCLEKKVNFVYKEGLLIEAMRDGTWVLLDEINLCNEETLSLIEAIICKTKIIHFDTDGQEETLIHPNFRLFACMNPHGDHGKKKFDSLYFNHILFYDYSADVDDIHLVIRNALREKMDKYDCEKLAEYYYELKKKIHTRELVNRIEPLLTGRTLVRALNSLKMDTEVEIGDLLSVLFLTQFNLQSKIIARNLMSEYFHLNHKAITKSFIDMDFILTPKVQMQLEDIKLAIRLCYPILIQGDTSTGKTSIIYYLAEKVNKEVLRINNHEHTEASDYLGNYITTPNGIEFKEGAFVKAIRRGDWVILDELNLAPSDVLEVLNRLLDDNREIFIPQLNETIKPHPDFRIFATQNLEYGGRKGLSKAFRNRFVEIFFEEKDDNEILEILYLKTGLPKSFCKNMVKVYSSLKNQRNVSYLMTLRDLFRWSKRVPRTMYEVFETGMSILYERQRTKMDKEKVYDVFKEVFTEIKLFDFLYKENECFNMVNLPLQDIDIVLTKSVRRLLTLLYAAVKCNEPVLLVGETGIGKTKLCNIISRVIGNDLSTLNMHSGTESSDFLGTFILKDSTIAWRDGVLVEAMLKGNSFLIDEINLAEDSVLERLNSLFETRREIFITEVEKNVKAHENFRLFATMNPGNDFGKRELSPALRNRFTEIYYELDNEEIQEIFRAILVKNSSLPSNLLDKIYKSVSYGHSLRSYEAVTDFIMSINQRENSIVNIRNNLTEEELVNEALCLINPRKDLVVNVDHDDNVLSVYPYSVYKKQSTKFNFTTETTSKNLLRILRSMVLKKGILLEGEPGVGKTSIVSNLASIIGKKCIRINLSEQTELSDLVGTYIPTERGIEFIPSELTMGLQNGDFIILDEINLCTQSVIEGLNSVLDFRRTLYLPEITIKVHPETKIFATMNPYNNENGRKILPRSFRDRFIVLYMDTYSEKDILQIISSTFEKYNFYTNCSLRENIKRNILKDFVESDKIEYEFRHTGIKIGHFTKEANFKLPTDYTILHSQIRSLERLLLSIEYKLPVILSNGVGKVAMINFVCTLLSRNSFDFICHKDIDTSDLLGQYHKTDKGVFKWKDSPLIEAIKEGAIVVIHNPELVEKSIFDRLNSVFESERFLSIYEKGIATNVIVHPDTRFILISTNPFNLSPALIDRCVNIELQSRLDSIDVWKMFCKNPTDLYKLIKHEINQSETVKRTKSEVNMKVDINDWTMVKNKDVKDLYIHMKKFVHLGIKPAILDYNFKGIYNLLLEDDINKLFEYKPSPVNFDVSKIKYVELYKKYLYNIPISKSDTDKMRMLESCSGQDDATRSITFLKNSNFSFINKSIPRDLKDLKRVVIKSLGNLTFNEYTSTKKICERLAQVNYTTSFDFDESYFEMLLNLNDDPLRIYKNFLEYEKNRQQSILKEDIYREMKKLYKYGEGSIEKSVCELRDISEKYDNEIKIIEDKPPRDYTLFKDRFMKVDFEIYYNDLEIRMFFEDYADVFNYFLLYLFKINSNPFTKMALRNSLNLSWLEYVSSLRKLHVHNESLTELCTYESLAVYIINTKRVDILKEMEYSKIGSCLSMLVYSILLSNPQMNITGLVNEAIHCEDKFDLNEVPALEFSNEMINECLLNIFNPKRVAYLIDNRRQTVCIGGEIASSLSIKNLSIFSRPSEVLGKIEEDISGNTNLVSFEVVDLDLKLKDVNLSDTHKHLLDVKNELGKYFKNSTSCTWLTNYRYVLYLMFQDIGDGQRYFLDCLVYEFYDRMKIAECMALRRSESVFYNIVLQYKAFEIEGEVERKIKESQAKIRKEPKLFKKIHEELKNYVTLPVTNILEVKFSKPECVCESSKPNPCLVLINKEGDSCGCESWLSLAENFNRREIENKMIDFEGIDRFDVINKFYKRHPETKFSFEEICLSKVISRMTDDATHLKLINIALEVTTPAFLYFVFQYSEDKENVEYEDGTGIKGGTGEKNISDEIKDEEEISNEYDDQGNVEEDDGVDFDNQGSISTCDEDEASQTGVEGDEEKEEEKDDQQQDELQQSEHEDNFNDVEDFEETKDEEMLLEEENPEEDEMPLDDAKTLDDEMPADEHQSQGVENEYTYKEQALNNNQSCSNAEDYERKVFGENVEEEALCEGEGEEQIVGNEETGEAYGEMATVNINYRDSSSHSLTLLLRSIFESNRYNKYKGDYKSGKKLNMKKIIPYIASDYQKDKIWMKRRKSDKKDYVVRLFVDNSRSMYSQSMVDTLFVTFSRLSNSFQALGIPVEIYKFGNELVECTIKEMTFSDTETNIDWIDQFKDGINIVLTDGVFQNTSFYNNNFLIILIDRSGIKKMSKVSVCEGNIFVQKYLDQFQLKYCTIEKVEELENTFILALSELIKNTNE